MRAFQFLFSLNLSEMILQHTDQHSQTLPSPELSSTEDQGIAIPTVETLQSLCSDSNFELFWLNVGSSWMLRRLSCQGNGKFPGAVNKVMLKQNSMLQLKISIGRSLQRLSSWFSKHVQAKTMKRKLVLSASSVKKILIEGSWS